MATKKINYPYLPKGREIKFVGSENEYILAAKEAAMKAGCRKQPTGAVLVKDGKIIMTATNASTTVSVCPRVLKGSKTGTDYHFCKEVCNQDGHSEYSAVQKCLEKGIDIKDADIYLWGHWWCCKPCWDKMIEGEIKNVYLEKNADEKFMFSATIGKIYISGALTIQPKGKNLRKSYENLAAVCSNFCSNVYVPHLNSTDPIKDPNEVPSIVWKTDHREVASSDIVVAYVGAPSLGTGAELEIARMAASDIVVWWYKGEMVSRMCLGNPNVKYKLEVINDQDLAHQLKLVLRNY